MTDSSNRIVIMIFAIVLLDQHVVIVIDAFSPIRSRA